MKNKTQPVYTYKLLPGDNRDEHFAFQQDWIKCLLRHRMKNGRSLPNAAINVGINLVTEFRARTNQGKNPKGTAWPRLLTLANHADIRGSGDGNRKTQVSRALKVLETEGFVIKIKRGYGFEDGNSAPAVWGFTIPNEDLEWLRSLDTTAAPTGIEGFHALLGDKRAMRGVTKKWEELSTGELPLSLLLDATAAILQQKEFSRANWDGFVNECAREFWDGEGDHGDDVGNVVELMRDWEDVYRESSPAVLPPEMVI